MPSLTRFFLAAGAFSAMLSVMFGAFGAHALRTRLTPDMLSVFHTAVQYQFYHSLGLLAVAAFIARYPHLATLRMAGWFMIGGIVIFSGSLYVLSLTGVRWLGAITPIGGVAFILGWVSLVIAALRAP